MTPTSPTPPAGAETPTRERDFKGVWTETGGVGERSEVVLDDIEARPGSTTSMLRTLIGLYLRPLGGEISSAALVRLAGDLGIPAGPARTGITRLKQRGLVLPAPGRRYALNPAAVPMLERGDQRIFGVRIMRPGDPWALISVTIPETRRDLRHQLRRRLPFIGAGSVAAGLWIVPGHLRDEADGLLREVGAREFATLFLAHDPQPAQPLAEAVGHWWDLAALRVEHERFLASTRLLDLANPFAAYVRLIDSWRVLPYIDPGLPAELLPEDWPGVDSSAAFAELSARLTGAASKHVRAIAG